MVSSFPKPKLIAAVCVISVYVAIVNVNLSQKARYIARERELSTDLGGGQCFLDPPHKSTTDPGGVRTLLVGYPGSGKRFTYEVIEGLTDHRAADDWGFSGYQNTPIIKTSYPHHEGTWSYGNEMDQTIMVLRNPRWSIPSYHNMKFELNFATNWLESYARLPNLYTERPSVAVWEAWRDENFEIELQHWVDHINFWMKNGTKRDGSVDEHCQIDLLDCKPKTCVDFDVLYNEHPTTEFYKLGKFLDASENVEVISKQARACILDAVYDHTAGSAISRNGHGDAPNMKRFTAFQLDAILTELVTMIDMYDDWALAGDTSADDLVTILQGYQRQIEAEKLFELDMEQEALA